MLILSDTASAEEAVHRLRGWLCLAVSGSLLGSVAVWAETAEPAPAERPVLVATRRVEPHPYDLTLPVKLGVLEAGAHATLAFDGPGRLAWIAEEGSRLEAGESVARLESRLEAARLHQAELMLLDAHRELERIRGLREARAASAKAQEAAQTQRDLRESELEVAREQLRRRTLRAPFTGVVTETLLEVGEVAGAGTPIATLMDLDPLQLEVGVPGYQVSQVRPGAKVRVEIPALGDRNALGVVHKVAVAAPADRHLFRVEIHVPNPEGDLRAGMAARASIVIRSLPVALAIPQELAVPRKGHPVVFFADARCGHRLREW